MAVSSKQRQVQAAVTTAATIAGTRVLLGRAVTHQQVCNHATEMSKAASSGGRQQQVNDHAATDTAITRYCSYVASQHVYGRPGSPSGWVAIARPPSARMPLSAERSHSIAEGLALPAASFSGCAWGRRHRWGPFLMDCWATCVP